MNVNDFNAHYEAMQAEYARNEFFMRIFFVLFAIIMLGIVLYRIYELSLCSKERKRNNRSPIMSVHAKVLAKRSSDSVGRTSRPSPNPKMIGYEILHTTSFFATFRLDNGERFELELPGPDYGLLMEGDEGILAFQGTRFLAFKRE